METDLQGMSVGIIGYGRVGAVLGARLAAAGLSLTAVRDPRPVRKPPVPGHPDEFRRCRLVFLCVPDDGIVETLVTAVNARCFLPETVIAHTSGAFGPGIFPKELHEVFHFGAFHPMMAFPPDPAGAMPFQGIGFSIDGDDTARRVLDRVAARLGGFSVHVEESMRGLYHAAAVMASNFTVFLEQAAAELLEKTGLPPGQARDLLDGLMRSVRHNIAGSSAKSALSGPAVRGDEHTLRRHREELKSHAPDLLPLYDVLTLAIRASTGESPALPSRTKSDKVSADFESEGTHDEKSNSRSHQNNT